MLGFTLPLFIILAGESAVGALLLCPKPLCNPAISLARASYTQVGSTVFHTLAGVLALLLASPIYDGARLYYSTKDASEQVSPDLRWVSEGPARLPPLPLALVVSRGAQAGLWQGPGWHRSRRWHTASVAPGCQPRRALPCPRSSPTTFAAFAPLLPPMQGARGPHAAVLHPHSLLRGAHVPDSQAGAGSGADGSNERQRGSHAQAGERADRLGAPG